MAFLNPWRGLGKLPREVWLLSTVTLVNRVGSMVLPFLVLYLTKRLGFSPARAGLALTFYGVGALFSAPMGGWLSDRYGSLPVMRLSLIASGTTLLLYPTVHTYLGVVLFTILLALTTEVFRPANLAAVTDFVEAEQRKPAFSLMRLAVNLGMSVGPALGGFLATVSFVWLFVIDGATSLIAGTLLIFTHFRKVEHHAIEKGPMSLGALKDARFLYCLAAVLPVLLVFFQHEGAMPLYLVRDLKMSEAIYGLLFSVNTIIIVLTEVPINVVTNEWPFSRSLGLGALLFGIGFGALYFAKEVWGAMVTVVIWTFGEMMLFPAMSAYVAHVSPPARRGEYMGLYTMTFSVAFCIGPWLGTLVLQKVGASPLWIATFVLGSISAFLLSRIRETSASVARASSPPKG